MQGARPERRAAGVPHRWFIQAGRAPQTTAVSAGWVWDWRWQARSAWFGGTWGGYTELAGSYWRNDSGLTAPKREFVQFGVTPVLRYWLDQDPGWFVEAGIGLNVITPKYDGGRREPFSTTFNFGDHLGVGWRAPGQGMQAGSEWSLRLQHFSNASIRRPNPGVNFIQLRWTRPL